MGAPGKKLKLEGTVADHLQLLSRTTLPRIAERLGRQLGVQELLGLEEGTHVDAAVKRFADMLLAQAVFGYREPLFRQRLASALAERTRALLANPETQVLGQSIETFLGEILAALADVRSEMESDEIDAQEDGPLFNRFNEWELDVRSANVLTNLFAEHAQTLPRPGEMGLADFHRVLNKDGRLNMSILRERKNFGRRSARGLAEALAEHEVIVSPTDLHWHPNFLTQIGQ